MINSSFYFIRNPIFSVAENRDFGRFVTTWYSVHCKHTRFFEFLGLLNEFFLEEAWFWGVRVGFGGREGALASALIYISVAKPYGRFGQKLESLQAGQDRTGQ